LGLKHFAETEFPYHLMSRYLIRAKPQEQLRAHVREMASAKAPHNIIKVICRSSIGSFAIFIYIVICGGGAHLLPYTF